MSKFAIFKSPLALETRGPSLLEVNAPRSRVSSGTISDYGIAGRLAHEPRREVDRVADEGVLATVRATDGSAENAPRSDAEGAVDRLLLHLRSNVDGASARVSRVRFLSRKYEDRNHSLVVHKELPEHASVLLQRLITTHKSSLHFVKVRLDVLRIINFLLDEDENSAATSGERSELC